MTRGDARSLLSGSLLEIAANTGAADQIKFLGTGEVMVDKATSFGISVGTTAYAGPLIESFTVGDKIDLHDVAFSSITLNFDAASGLLQVSGGAVAKASLLFDNSTLGAGTFQATNDGTGHTLIALS